MSTVIIGGGDGVRNSVAQVEAASLKWTEQQRADGEDLLKQVKLCLAAVADCGTPEQVTVSGP